MKKAKYVLIPLLITSIFIVIFNVVVDKRIETLMGEKDLSNIRHAYDQRNRNLGGYFRDYFAKEGDLNLLGSSELGSKVEQNPINLFPFNDSDYELAISGVAHMQNLFHAARIGGSEELNEDSKVAIIVSLQWFESKDGIKNDEFLPWFSEVQFYQFLSNPKISRENKEYLANRVINLLSETEMFNEEKIYARLYLRDGIKDSILYYALAPYYKVKEMLLETRDKLTVLKDLKSAPEKVNDEKKVIDFEEEYQRAEEQGMAAVTNDNPFNVEDSYYDTYIKDTEATLKDYKSDVDLVNSKEFEDYKFLLGVCEDLGIKPYIILMNVNGLYYDYVGITKEKRDEFYNKAEDIAVSNGLDVLNLQEYEYEKYYLTDVMHLGWLGWLNVSENLSEHFNSFKGE